jgi:hypothetical protein
MQVCRRQFSWGAAPGVIGFQVAKAKLYDIPRPLDVMMDQQALKTLFLLAGPRRSRLL